jgi:formate dehydrogenase subunit beta
MKGATVKAKDTGQAIIDLAVQMIEKKVLDAVLLPIKVPENDSYAYVLAKDVALLKKGSPLPPVMAIQGPKGLSRLTRLERGSTKIGAIMRPCETRAAIELTKLKQIDPENVILISMDCPGALRLSDYRADPKKAETTFKGVVKEWGGDDIRQICKMCENSSMMAGDLHIGTLGAKSGTVFVIPNSQKGDEVLERLGMKAEEGLGDRDKKVEAVAGQRAKKREEVIGNLRERTGGIDGLIKEFSECIACHNCMRVCPICYCQLCYFESDVMNHPSTDYMHRAQMSGSLRFPPDTMLFHIGRMLHMSLSCVSCGACEDACPMSIPVAQVFSMAARDTQALFEYVSGRDRDEEIPIITYKEDELKEMGE